MNQPNIDDSSTANAGVVPNSFDQRSEPRIERNIQFFVEIQTCECQPDIEGTSFDCSTIDFSRRGIQFRTQAIIPHHATVDINVGLGEPFAMYKLRGEVRWVLSDDDALANEEPAAPNERLGILLDEDAGMDYARWVDEFETNFGAAPVIRS